ncbi:MAG: phage holin family protein [Verrucomicrobia bacterium]|nr:phage holin family protein [Verrucomicrobiota bacterium]
MEPAADSFGQFGASSKHLARRLLTIGENRLELLMVEVQEERERLLRAILLALGVAVFGFLTGAALTIAIVVLLWRLSPVAVLLVLTSLYAAIAVYLYRRFAAIQRDWKTFPATLDQLGKDRSCLETILD